MLKKSIFQKIFNSIGFEIYGKKDFQLRTFASNRYLRGNGIEIGALNKALPLPKSARVLYVDRHSFKKLRSLYPEVGDNIVKPDVIDDGEKLTKFKDNSLDFVIANHFLEHCKNPIGAIENILRVLKQDGMIYTAIPDKRYTFDKNRQITPIEHLFEVYKYGEDKLLKEHFEDWVKNVEGITDEIKFRDRINLLISIDSSIHYHVWTTTELLKFFLMLKIELKFKLELEMFIRNNIESIFIFRKL